MFIDTKIVLITPVFTDTQQKTMERSVSFPPDLKEKHKTAESETEFDSSSSDDDEGYHSEAETVDDTGLISMSNGCIITYSLHSNGLLYAYMRRCIE